MTVPAGTPHKFWNAGDDEAHFVCEVRPALQMDGGDVELVGVDEGIVKVRLLGACGGCPMATMTLVGFVEERHIFAPERAQKVNIYEAVADHLKALLKSGSKAIIASYSAGARDRRRP